MTTLDTHIELIDIAEGVVLQFIHIPDDFKFTKFTMTDHTTQYLGKLKSLNRVKLLNHWKADNGCLVKGFTKVLQSRGWDFEKYPNPVASIAIHHTVYNK